MRRGFLLALVALAIAAALPARAQDARSTAVQDAARAWLALADKNDADAAYDAAGGKFHRQVPKDQWAKALTGSRAPLGANLRRTVATTQFLDRIKGFGKGDYAVLVFRSSFANKDFAREQVTVEKTAKGWQVIGYFIH
jgi:Protein of unknown function (DUF4019)